jgi:predicted component of type VI protein secretion system
VAMPALVVRSGPLAGRRVEVGAELVLGREHADVTLDDEEVSRRHALVRPVPGGLEVEDLGSLNGTWVNGARIERAARLAPGDELRVGTITLAVEAGPAAAPATKSAPAAEAAPPAPAAGEADRAGTPVPAGPAAPAAPPMPRLGAFAPPPRPRRRSVASRRLTPTLLSFGAVIVTAVALLVYFAGR